QTALVLVRIFVGHQHGAAPFAAKPDALQDAQQEQNDRGRDADLLITGQKSDQHRGDTHDHQRQDEHAFAADAVTEVTENESADRTRDKADREGGVGKQDRNQRILHREEQLVEHDAGYGAVQKEVVPFDGRTDHAGGDDAP